jgi:hypothetical protein
VDNTVLGGSYSVDTITIPSTYYTTASNVNYGNITISNGGSSNWGNGYLTAGTNTPGLHVTGDAEFEGKVKINGQDLAEFMDTISKRLAILVPDPAKLEHFEALKKAYNHYKVLEALCQLPKKESE